MKKKLLFFNEKLQKLTKTKHRSGPLRWPCTSEHCQHPNCAFLKNLPLSCVLSFAFVPSAPCTIDVSVPAAGFEGCPEMRVCVFAFAHFGVFSNFGVCAHTLCANSCARLSRQSLCTWLSTSACCRDARVSFVRGPQTSPAFPPCRDGHYWCSK